MTEAITLLGSTGSVGINTLDVVSRNADRFSISALSGHSNAPLMLQQCQKFLPSRVVMVDAQSAKKLQHEVARLGLDISVESGSGALDTLASGSGDTVVCGIVGSAGLSSTLAAVDAGKKVLIANKEPLVMLGQVIVAKAKRSGAVILPLDSEHNAIFQCLPQKPGRAANLTHMGIKKILLTGSGGPLRKLPLEEMEKVTPEQACAHPNWRMGQKISVDSATMMNKGLELIEACVLFDVAPSMVEIVIHPQSIIHSMVEYIDGSIIAQLGSPDMRIPIANALSWPDRVESGAKSLDFREISRFDFAPPDSERFPALKVARMAAENAGTLPAIMSAANEVAVASFLQGNIPFTRIVETVEWVMQQAHFEQSATLENVLAADKQARELCLNALV